MVGRSEFIGKVSALNKGSLTFIQIQQHPQLYSNVQKTLLLQLLRSLQPPSVSKLLYYKRIFTYTCAYTNTYTLI